MTKETDAWEFLEGVCEEDFKRGVKERARGLCESCLSGGKKVEGKVVHHIWPVSTAKKPSKWDPRAFEGPLWCWPHVEPNGIYLCRACHSEAHGDLRRGRKYAGIRISRPHFYRLLLDMYGDRIWEGKTYREWLNEEPFRRWL